MRLNRTVAYAMMAMVAMGMPARSAEETPVAAKFNAAISTHYTWRGQVLNDEPVLQPAVEVSKNGLTFSWWGNNNLTDQITGTGGEFSEHDIGLAYSIPASEQLALTLGLVNYDFPNTQVADTMEVYLIAALPHVLLEPTLYVYYDTKEVNAFYGNLGVSKTFELCASAGVKFCANVGFAEEEWNAFYFGGDQANSLVDGSFMVCFPTKITDNLTVSPAIQYTKLLDGDVEDAADANSAYFNDGDVVVGTITASYTF